MTVPPDEEIEAKLAKIDVDLEELAIVLFESREKAERFRDENQQLLHEVVSQLWPRGDRDRASDS